MCGEIHHFWSSRSAYEVEIYPLSIHYQRMYGYLQVVMKVLGLVVCHAEPSWGSIKRVASTRNIDVVVIWLRFGDVSANITKVVHTLMKTAYFADGSELLPQ